MAAHLPSRVRLRARTGAYGTLPAAVLLATVVVLAAGLGGLSDFTGPRWFPHIGSGGRLRPRPIKHPETGGTPSRPSHGKPSTIHVPLWLEVLALVLLAAALVAAAVWLWSRRRRFRSPAGLQASTVHLAPQPVVAEPEPEPEPEVLRTGIELALQVLDEGREPADAVVRAWIGLQETAAESGIVRQPSESPTEFTARILRGAFADDQALRTLLRLYLRARFGDHPVTAQDVDAVREALAQLVASWRRPEGTVRVGLR